METSLGRLRRQGDLCPLSSGEGQIERPYRWIQDRLVRTCVRDNVADIRPAQTLLSREIQRYNFHQVIPPRWRFLISDFKEL